MSRNFGSSSGSFTPISQSTTSVRKSALNSFCTLDKPVEFLWRIFGSFAFALLAFVPQEMLSCTKDEDAVFDANFDPVCNPVDCKTKYNDKFVYIPSARLCLVPSPTPSPLPAASPGSIKASSSPGGKSDTDEEIDDTCMHGVQKCVPWAGVGSGQAALGTAERCFCDCHEGWLTAPQSDQWDNTLVPNATSNSNTQVLKPCQFKSTHIDTTESDLNRASPDSENCGGLQCLFEDTTYALSTVGILVVILVLFCLCCKPCRRLLPRCHSKDRKRRHRSGRRRRRSTGQDSYDDHKRDARRRVHTKRGLRRETSDWDFRRRSSALSFYGVGSSRASSYRQHGTRSKRNTRESLKRRSSVLHTSHKYRSTHKGGGGRADDTVKRHTGRGIESRNPVQRSSKVLMMPTQSRSYHTQAYHPEESHPQTHASGPSHAHTEPSWSTQHTQHEQPYTVEDASAGTIEDPQEQVYWDESGQYWWDSNAQDWVWAGSNGLADALAANSGASDPDHSPH